MDADLAAFLLALADPALPAHGAAIEALEAWGREAPEALCASLIRGLVCPECVPPLRQLAGVLCAGVLAKKRVCPSVLPEIGAMAVAALRSPEAVVRAGAALVAARAVGAAELAAALAEPAATGAVWNQAMSERSTKYYIFSATHRPWTGRSALSRRRGTRAPLPRPKFWPHS